MSDFITLQIWYMYDEKCFLCGAQKKSYSREVTRWINLCAREMRNCSAKSDVKEWKLLRFIFLHSEPYAAWRANVELRTPSTPTDNCVSPFSLPLLCVFSNMKLKYCCGRSSVGICVMYSTCYFCSIELPVHYARTITDTKRGQAAIVRAGADDDE